MKRIVMVVVTVLLVVLDQLVKYWARENLISAGRVVVIEGVLGLRYATNAGAAFGILQGARWFFVAVTILVLGVIVWYEFKLPQARKFLWIRVPMVLMAAGAIGNFIDRLLAGYVVDMFEFLFISFPIFNVADVLLVAGMIIYAFATIFILKESPEAYIRKAGGDDGGKDAASVDSKSDVF